MTLTIEQRDRLLSILPKYEEKKTGRKRANLARVFLGIVWVLESGARWEDINKAEYGSYQTCHRYFQEWQQSGVFVRALAELVKDAEDAGLLKLHEAFIDGSFVPAKKGAMRLATATEAKALG